MKRKINLRDNNGQKHGFWRLKEHAQDFYGYYTNGIKQGYWVYKSSDSEDYSIGKYVNEQQIGYWEHKLTRTKIKEFYII